MPESIEWLMAHKQNHDAMVFVKKVAKFNKLTFREPTEKGKYHLYEIVVRKSALNFRMSLRNELFTCLDVVTTRDHYSSFSTT